MAATASTLYLTAGQVSEMYQVDTATVYRWASTDPTMPATRISGTVRFEAQALHRWLASHTQKSRKQRVSGATQAQIAS
jgi:predicted DNA-binding transcriptional regulator AlpA